MKQTLSAGGVVVNNEGSVLVVSQGDSWSLPKGHIDPGENARQAAEREIAEESGITQLSYLKDFGSYERHRIKAGGRGEDMSELKTITMFLYTTSQFNLQPTDPHNPEARWVEPDEVAELLTHPKDKAFFESILPQIKELVA